MKNLRNKNHWIIYFLVPLFFCTGCQFKDEAEYKLRAGLLVNEDHTWYQAFQYFGELLHERSEGRITLEVYPSEQLAKEAEAIRLIRLGAIDMTATGSLLNNFFELASFCEMPFLFEDTVDMQAFIHGPIGQEIEKKMIEITGLRPVAYFERGPRHLTSKRPIKHPDDLKGLIVRVPNVPTFITAWSALGAKPTPMAFSEVFTSLQQGAIDAQENPLPLVKSAGFSEVQDYVNLTGHVMSWVYPVISEEKFQKFPEDLQQIFLDAAKDMQTFEHKLFLENQEMLRSQLEAQGMEFVEVDKQAFRKASEEAIYQSLSMDMQKIYNELRKQL